MPGAKCASANLKSALSSYWPISPACPPPAGKAVPLPPQEALPHPVPEKSKPLDASQGVMRDPETGEPIALDSD